MPDQRTYGFNRDDAETLIQGIGTGEKPFPEVTARVPTPDIVGRLDEPLSPAAAFASSPSTAVLSVWRRNADGDFEDSNINATVVNRLLYVEELATDTICYCRWVEGEWVVYVADCNPS